MVTNSAKSDDIDDSSAPLVEHLKELRSRLIWSVLAFVVAMVLCYFVWNPIFDFLTQPVCMALEKRGQTCGLILLKMQEGFFVAMRIAFFGGFVLAYPVDYQTTGGVRLWAGLDAAARLREFDGAIKAWLGLVAYRLSHRSSALFPAPP